jgi:Chemotaxis response regulator containing a CheY-like receiver domain and a methylesterase domain
VIDMANVLVVDDSFFVRAAIRKMLESSNLVENVYEASNGLEALDILKKAKHRSCDVRCRDAKNEWFGNP